MASNEGTEKSGQKPVEKTGNLIWKLGAIGFILAVLALWQVNSPAGIIPVVRDYSVIFREWIQSTIAPLLS